MMAELPELECKALDEQYVYIWLKERNEPLVGPLVVRYGAEIVKRCNAYEDLLIAAKQAHGHLAVEVNTRRHSPLVESAKNILKAALTEAEKK